MKLSVVVPVYNAEKYIAQMIQSLQHQTLGELEIILVDDGSTDQSGALCDRFGAEDSRIRVIHKKNAGVGAARNDGLDAATGEWIVFCDADDWVEPDAFEKLIRYGERCGADVVFGDVNLVYENGRVKPARFYRTEFVTDDRELIHRLIDADFCRSYCFDPPAEGPAFGYGGPWNKLARRQLLLEHSIRFDRTVKGIFDDLLYTAYLFAVAKRVAYTHVVVYNYRQLSGSITHRFKGDLLAVNEAIFAAWEVFMTAHGPHDRFLQPYYANVIRRLKSTLGQYFFCGNNSKPFFSQLRELRELLRSEPYATAIAQVDGNKLHNNYDKLIWMGAKLRSGLAVYAAYQLSILIKKVRNK